MTLLWFYIAGVCLFAFIYGFQHRFSQLGDGVRLVITTLGWPIVLISGFGSACRMFNAKRHAEDIADGCEP